MPRCAKKKQKEEYPVWEVAISTATPMSYDQIVTYFGQQRIRRESFRVNDYRPVFMPWYASTPAREAEALDAVINELLIEETTEE